MTPGKEEPLSVDVGQMIRIDDPRLCLAASGFAIVQFDLPPVRRRLGQSVEDLQVKDRLGARSERNRLLPVLKIEGNRVRQRRGHLLEGAHQRLLEVRSAILLQGLFRDQQGEQLALRDLHGGKGSDLLGVVIAVAAVVELDRKFHAVAHELQVAVDGLRAVFQLAGQRGGIGKPAGQQGLMDAHHPLQRRTRLRGG